MNHPSNIAYVDSSLFPPAFHIPAKQVAETCELEASTQHNNPTEQNTASSTLSTLKALDYSKLNKKRSDRKVSERIVLGKNAAMFPVVCEQTGAVIAAMIPSVQGYALMYKSPFARIENARGMALHGFGYLSQLDSQTIAAILITLANDKKLFRFQATDSGAQKNAILRTAQRETLIHAAVVISTQLQGAAVNKIPSLSLLQDTATAQFGMEARMRNWLKTVSDILAYKAEPEDTETNSVEFAPIRKQITSNTHSKHREAYKQHKRDFRGWKVQAKQDIMQLHTDHNISLKLRTFLLGILSEEMLVSSDPAMIELLCAKLDQLNNTAGNKIAIAIRKFTRIFRSFAGNEFDAPSKELFASNALGIYTVPEAVIESPMAGIAVRSKPLSLMEKIAAKRALAAQQAQTQVSETKENIPSDF